MKTRKNGSLSFAFRFLLPALSALSAVPLASATDAGIEQEASPNAATGGPGKMGTWSRPDKSGYGSARNRPVWFSLVDGSLSEIAFPTVDLVQTRDTFLVVRDQDSRSIWDERKNCQNQVTRVPGTLAFEVESDCPSAVIHKTFVASSDEDAMIAEYRVRWKRPGAYQLFLIHNPTSAATAGGDGIRVIHDGRGEPMLRAWQSDIRGDEPFATFPRASHDVGWTLTGSTASVGFEGVNAPEDVLARTLSSSDSNFLLRFLSASGSSANSRPRPVSALSEVLPQTDEALNGNVQGTLAAEVSADVTFRVFILFQTGFQTGQSGSPSFTVSESRWNHLAQPSREALIRSQRTDWQSYLSNLSYDRSDLLAESSILLLKALEDRLHPGALIAAPANPALPDFREAPELPYEEARLRRNDANSGYRRVWPRDLYHKAIALLSVGDRQTPVQTARWFKGVQLGDGTWSQNMWVEGTPSWRGYQADQTALPIVLVSRLVDQGLVDYAEFRNMVRRAADTLVRRGPGTQQERWEENGGLSPNTFAAVIEGLIAAARLERSGDGSAAVASRYEDTAQAWRAQLKNWLLVPQGALGERYFARLEISSPWDPKIQDNLWIANIPAWKQRTFREDEIIDGGFLEWIIAGLVDPWDSDFSNTIRIYDQKLRRQTPFGAGYPRYTHDAYGENFEGGIWPLLSAERALAALERGEPTDEHLQLIQKIATPAGLIGEQDTLAVRPLGWSHAAYLILKRSLAEGQSFYKQPGSRALGLR